MPEVGELSPSEFLQRWPNGPERDNVVLLDVREQEELEVASVKGVWHIPMNQVPKRLDELPRDKPLVVMCHVGGRSRRVAEFLIGNGFDHVFNLDGGIDAWSRNVDETIPRY